MKLGILISGGGTTFLNLHERIAAGSLRAQIVRVLSSSRKARGLDLARERGYAADALVRRQFADDDAYSAAIVADMQAHGADLIICAGFLKKFNPAPPYLERTLNIHPSLIPAFCGHGYYGMKVHEAVYARGCRVSGCTVHLVNEIYDAGPILIQDTVQLADGDTPEDIRRKVFELECEALPRAVNLFADGRVRVENGRAVISEA